MKPTTITIPGERAEQLRYLAAQHNVPISELIEWFIGDQIAAGHLPDELPGFEVESIDGLVVITVHNEPFAAFGRPDARNFANALELFASGNEGKMMTFRANHPALTETTWHVARKGRGVKIAANCEDGSKVGASMTLGMAHDLARIIRKAAA